MYSLIIAIIAILISILILWLSYYQKETFINDKFFNISNRKIQLSIDNKFLAYNRTTYDIELMNENNTYFIIQKINEPNIGINQYRLFHPESLDYLSYIRLFQDYKSDSNFYYARFCAIKNRQDPTRLFIVKKGGKYIIGFVFNEKTFYLSTKSNSLIWINDKNKASSIAVIFPKIDDYDPLM